MIRPVHFHFNEETALNNSFQQKHAIANLQELALQEFDHFVSALGQEEIEVNVITDTPEPPTPDSIFPNNWVSFHEDGTIILYPMFAENRRLERRMDILDTLSKKYLIKRIIDLSSYEQQGQFLEGTGSMVLDNKGKLAYMCLSPRSHRKPFEDFCSKMDYFPVIFHAFDQHHQAIYHTNVMLCIAEDFAVLCSESIRDEEERNHVIAAIRTTGREIIDISFTQLSSFAGNMLQLTNKKGEDLLLMSEQAFQSLHYKQVKCLEKYVRLIHIPLGHIEEIGGGSARCMIAEIFLTSIL